MLHKDFRRLVRVIRSWKDDFQMLFDPKFFNELVRISHQQIRKMDDTEVAARERFLELDSHDLKSRAFLIGYYARRHDANSYLKHVSWVVANRPDHSAAQTWNVHFMLDRDVFNQLKTVWLKQSERHPRNVYVQKNAASFFRINHHNCESDIPVQILTRAIELNSRSLLLRKELIRVYSKSVGMEQEALTAFTELRDSFDRLDVLCELQEFPIIAFRAQAYEIAMQMSNQLLAKCSQESDHWNINDVINSCHTVLGLLATRIADFQRARFHLQKSLPAVIQSNLDVRQPSMVLARALVKAGQPGEVLAYLDKCEQLPNNFQENFEIRFEAMHGVGFEPETLIRRQLFVSEQLDHKIKLLSSRSIADLTGSDRSSRVKSEIDFTQTRIKRVAEDLFKADGDLEAIAAMRARYEGAETFDYRLDSLQDRLDYAKFLEVLYAEHRTRLEALLVQIDGCPNELD